MFSPGKGTNTLRNTTSTFVKVAVLIALTFINTGLQLLHTEALNKMEERIEGLCRVVNKQTNTIRELREAVDANDNIIVNQQEWIVRMRGQRECNCGAVDPLLATMSGEVVLDSEDEDAEGELEYADEDPGTSLDAGV